MKEIELIQSITQRDPILANAVSRMIDYIQDRWAAPYPSKEQTEAVNAIRVLDSGQLDRLQDVLNRIAADREYYMPERGYVLGR